MDIRSNETPMDFQWQKGHGPAGSDSPFLKAAANHHQHQKGFAAHKRPFSQYLSPTKATLPSLREPASQTFLFPSTPSMKPPIQFRNPSFTTPQKSFEIDFSSGAENQSSPGNGDDEDTPELPRRSGTSRTNPPIVQFAGNKSEKKLGGHATPGRGEISRKLYTDAIPRRVQKRRRRDADRDMRIALHHGPSYDSDSDSRSRPSSQEGGASRQKQQPFAPVKEIGIIPSIFTFIEKHPNLPHILSYYAQFLLNVFLVFFMMYLVYSFWSTIRSDVDLKSREVASETLAEMSVCAREFKENRCDRSSRVPAMETVCDNWEKCMKQDPTKVGRARVSANTFAEILNNFIEPISAKTMIVSFILIFGCFAISNMTLMFFRNKIPTPPPSHAHAQPHPQGPYMHPHAHQMGYPEPQFYTPYQNQMQAMARHDGNDGGGGGGYGQKLTDPQSSPVRRLGYR